MKKKITFLTITMFILSILLVGCGSKTKTDTSLKDVKEKGEFIVGLDDSFPPMGFRDNSGKIVGFDIDMAKEVGNRMGVKVIFKPVDWDGVVLSLKNKDIDVIWNGLTITEERKKQIGFSDTYLQNKQIIVIRKNSKINSKKDLAGKIIGLQLGSTSEQALSSDPETEKSLKDVKKYATNTEALLDLKSERLEAVVVDEVVGRYYLQKKPGVYKILDEDFGKESYVVGLRKDDVSFKEELNKTLNEIKSDGTAKKISEKWFGKDILKK